MVLAGVGLLLEVLGEMAFEEAKRVEELLAARLLAKSTAVRMQVRWAPGFATFTCRRQ